MQLNQIHKVYFIGIGGIGMSALARFFKHLGKTVAGYDRIQSNITEQLEKIGVAVNFSDTQEAIPAEFLNNKNSLVIYTPAIPRTNTQLIYFQKNNFQIKKRSEVLGLATQNSFCIAIGGTHGKTTTSAILAHILKASKMSVTAFLGGISENYNSNFIYQGNQITVVEADEFDRSFLQLNPDIACVNSMDADHLDIYGKAASLHQAFSEFVAKLKPDGKLFVKEGLPLKGKTFGFLTNSDYQILNIAIKNGLYIFDIKTPKTIIQNLKFQQPGKHNLMNALVAVAMALELNIPTEKISQALATYKGVKRRFSYRFKSKERIIIDDYAHHPTEIDAIHTTLNDLYPNENKLVVFQPHLYSRTKDFALDFAKSLSRFDEVLLLPIYPAREVPIDGVSSRWLLSLMNHSKSSLISKTKLSETIRQSSSKIVAFLGAGDIADEVTKVTDHIRKQ